MFFESYIVIQFNLLCVHGLHIIILIAIKYCVVNYTMNTFFFPLKKKWSDLAPNVLRYSVWSIILSFAHFNPLINVFSIISSFPTHCPNVSSIWRLKKNYYLYLLVPVLSLFSSDDLLQNSRRKLEKYTRLFSHLLFHLYKD